MSRIRVRTGRRLLNICSLSAIIICRFHLDLQRNTLPNPNTSQGLPTISLGSFRAASQRVHDEVMAEFGCSLAVEAEAAEDEVVTLDLDVIRDDGG